MRFTNLYVTNLYRFTNLYVKPLPFGITNLYVTFEYKSYFKTILTKLMVMNILSIYNAKPTHTKQIEGDIVDLPYGDKVFDKTGIRELRSNPRESC